MGLLALGELNSLATKELKERRVRRVKMKRFAQSFG